MEKEVRKSQKETPLAFMILGMLGFVAMVCSDFLFGSGANNTRALMGMIVYFVLFVWTFYRVLTGRSGHKMLGSLFGLTVGYAFCIGFYAPGRYAVWVMSGCLSVFVLIGIISYYVDWFEKRRLKEVS